jgi:hypothetical protein
MNTPFGAPTPPSTSSQTSSNNGGGAGSSQMPTNQNQFFQTNFMSQLNQSLSSGGAGTSANQAQNLFNSVGIFNAAAAVNQNYGIGQQQQQQPQSSQFGLNTIIQQQQHRQTPSLSASIMSSSFMNQPNLIQQQQQQLPSNEDFFNPTLTQFDSATNNYMQQQQVLSQSIA